MTKEVKLNIYQRLNRVMGEVRYVQKRDKTNNKMYSYVNHDDVSAAIQPYLVQNGIALVTNVKDLKQEGNRTSVNLEVSFVNIDDPKDCITVQYPGYGIDTQDKGIGKAISYAFKYCLLKTFCLETGDDVERDNIEYKPETINDMELSTIESGLAEFPSIRKEILKFLSKEYKVTTLADAPKESYDRICKAMRYFTEKELEKVSA